MTKPIPTHLKYKIRIRYIRILPGSVTSPTTIIDCSRLSDCRAATVNVAFHYLNIYHYCISEIKDINTARNFVRCLVCCLFHLEMRFRHDKIDIAVVYHKQCMQSSV